MKLKSVLIGGVMVICAGLAVFGLTKLHRETVKEEDVQTEAAPVITVQTGALRRMTLHRYIDGYGTVEAAPASADQAGAGGTLSAQSAGVVAKVNAIEGQQVKEGDVVEVREKARDLVMVLGAVQSSERDVPEYIEADHKKMSAKFVRVPALADVPYPVTMEPHLVTEFYSR